MTMLRRRHARMVPSHTVVTPRAAPRHDRGEPTLRFRDARHAPGGELASVAVPNDGLRPDMVPRRDSPWEVVQAFALTYDGHAYWDDVAELAGRGWRDWARTGAVYGRIDQLRGSLFYEQRRWHHFGEAPSERAAQYVWALLDAIREHVAAERAATPAPAAAAPAAMAPAVPVGAVVRFVDDDAGFRAWCLSHGTGVVMGMPARTARAGSAKSPKLHRTSCSSVAGATGSTRPLTSGAGKACAIDVAALTAWSTAHLGTEPDLCLRCGP
ncbi:MAG TPA: hypothetical protein VKR22_06630 [Acidimicrobiales bacterium]|nr:hypothetical protein [Acidimicrobiales bacterium]